MTTNLSSGRAPLWVSVATLCCVAMLQAADESAPAVYAWQGQDTRGEAVALPDPKRVAVVAFIAPAQDRTPAYVAQLTERLADVDGLRVLAVVSGKDAATEAGALIAKTDWRWPVVADPDYELSGRMKVHVWPTTVVLDTDGHKAGHLPGLSASFARDLLLHVDFAAGRIDEPTLRERLASNDHVASTPEGIARRHQHLAEKLLERGQIQAAHDQFIEALEHLPDDPALTLSLARTNILLGRYADAVAQLRSIEPGALPAWRINTLLGRALIALDRWDEARPVLEEALKLNADPSEAHYFLGQVHEHDQDMAAAAKHYRAAFEHCRAGRTINGE